MVRLELRDDPAAIAGAELLVVPFFASQDGPAPAVPDLAAEFPWIGQAQAAVKRDRRFTAAAGEVAPVLVIGAAEGQPDILAVGLGSSTIDVEALGMAARASAQACSGRSRVSTLLGLVGQGMGDQDRAAALRAVAEGMVLGSYRFAPKGDDAGDTCAAIMTRPGESALAETRRAIDYGRVSGETANWARRLVDTPPADLPPAVLAATLAARAGELGIDADIWDRPAMLERGFGATAGVGAASVNQPCVLVLTATSRRGGARLGLAGKGITFDSGGINLKRNLGEIFRMKSDMAGAAAVAGAIFAAAELGAEPHVLAILPMAENMPGGAAQRPGDVVTHPDGQRTEIVDTDCEGRLILADAIAYLVRQQVSGIIDVGTLTDGGGVGPLLWGCWSTDDALVARVLEAGRRAGEPGWRLPLRPEYATWMQSQIADIGNSPLSVPDIGLTAATYLRRFAGATPWVHVDNGSSAYMEHPIGAWPVGATASPMRALLQLLVDRS